MALQSSDHSAQAGRTGQLRALTLLSWTVFAVALACIAAWIYACHKVLNDPSHAGRNLDIDFSVYWAAAKMGVAGDWLGPFDTGKLSEARLIPLDREGYEMLWFYPPAYHMLIAPLGYLPFFWSWLVFGAASLAALAFALRAPTRGMPIAIALVVFSPSAIFLLALGQNSLLIAALLVGALEALRRDRMILAGLIIAAMTIKPQLGLAIPVALLAGGYWRVIVVASFGTAVLVGATYLALGAEYWSLFFQAVLEGGDRIRHTELVRVMISGFGNAVSMGFGQNTAMYMQLALSVGSAACLGWLWRSPGVSFDLKAAGLCVTVLLMTPYAIHYELIFAVLAAFYLARDGAGDFASGRYLIVLLWFAPAIGYAMLPWPGFAFSAALMLATLVYCLYRAGARAAVPSAYGTAK